MLQIYININLVIIKKFIFAVKFYLLPIYNLFSKWKDKVLINLKSYIFNHTKKQVGVNEECIEFYIEMQTMQEMTCWHKYEKQEGCLWGSL